MVRRGGWTLVELLVVIAIIAMLAGIAVPSLSLARERARLLGCVAGLRDTHRALMSYAGMNDRRLPPFRFSFVNPSECSLPLSGHWGGVSSAADPAAFGWKGDDPFYSINLWTLVEGGLIEPERLVCPGAPGSLRTGRASHFPHSSKFSTYCLRFPYSIDLFRESPRWAYYDRSRLLSIYAETYGGRKQPPVPLVRVDRRYRISDEARCGDGDYDVATDTMLADAFWYQDLGEDGTSPSDGQTYPVRSAWSHGSVFNAITGGGAVRTVRDDGTKVRPFTNAPGRELPNDGCNYASYAERVWQFLDGKE